MIVLDTHILIWWINNPDKLSDKARKRINLDIKKKEDILISSISIWEIYMLVKKGRLKFRVDIDTWIEKIEKLNFLRFIPVNNNIAAKSVMLVPPLHSDPADRIIIATALKNGATLITSDSKLLRYPHIQTLW